MALIGPSGSGKTFTALSVASTLGTVAVIDTEHGSASKCGDQFTFDVLELTDYHPQQYIDAIHAAGESAAYDVLVIDSLSHAWNGSGGVLEIVDKATKQTIRRTPSRHGATRRRCIINWSRRCSARRCT